MTSTRSTVRMALKDFLVRRANLADTAAILRSIPVAPQGQPAAVTLESLLQQYAAGYLSTEQVLQGLGV